MTTPLELAELLEEGPHRAGDAFIASELRRLAQVEAEHAALLKAISDAEPVAAQHRFRNPQKTMPDWSVWQPCHVTHSAEWELDAQGYETEYRNLYTLNGIKK